MIVRSTGGRRAGLGTAMAIWDQDHGPRMGTSPGAFNASYENHSYLVDFWVAGDAPATMIRRNWSGRSPLTYTAARGEVEALLPPDARRQALLTNPVAPGDGTIVDLYHSPSLAARYEPFRGEAYFWEEGPPGIIAVTYWGNGQGWKMKAGYNSQTDGRLEGQSHGPESHP